MSWPLACEEFIVLPWHLRVARLNRAGRQYLQRMVVKVPHFKIMQQQTAVRVRVRAHPAIALRGEIGQLRDQASSLVK